MQNVLEGVTFADPSASVLHVLADFFCGQTSYATQLVSQDFFQMFKHGLARNVPMIAILAAVTVSYILN